MSDRFQEERLQERRHALLEMLSSYAWKEVVRPALRARMRKKQEGLALKLLDIEDTRYEQGYYRALFDLDNNPEHMFTEE